MSDKNIGDQLIQGLKEAIRYMRGKKTGTIIHKINAPYSDDKEARLARPRNECT